MSKHILRKRTSGFTTVSNNVIQALKSDLETLGFYLYLLSLPDNWEFYKTYLIKECRIGIKKLDKLLKKLCALGLVRTVQMRNEKGQFAHFDFEIYDTESLKINNLEICAPEGQNCRTVETAGRFQEAIKEEVIKEVNKEKQNKYLCASDDARKSFEQFWNLYPRKKDKGRAFEVWIKENLQEKSELIIGNLAQQVLNDVDWNNIQFIPHPATYLRNRRWEDEITFQTLKSIPKKFNPAEFVLNQLKEDYKKGMN